jgi:uncharacterized membrane protein
MSHLTPDEVVALAQRRVAEHKADTSSLAPGEPAWRYAFGGLLGALLIGLLAWPGTPLPLKLYASIHGVCAQIHNVSLGSVQLPLCARNTGIYSSTFVTMLALLVLGRARASRLPQRGLLAALGLAVVVVAFDAFNSLFLDLGWPHLYTPQNWLRTLTGLGAGVAIGVLLLVVFNQALRADGDRTQRVLRGWRELLGIVTLNLVVWLAVYANIALAYWPVALLSWSGIVGTLFIVLLLPTAVLMGYRRRILHLTDLARPATVALLLTVAMLVVLGLSRFASEGWRLSI